MGKAPVLTILTAGLVLAGCASKTPHTHGAAPAPGVEAAPEVAAAERYGAPLTLAEVTTIKALNETPGDFLDRHIRIEGTVVGVCKGSGCWVEVKQADGSTIIAKSLDHSVAVPTDCEGRSIVVQGVFKNLAAPAHAHDEAKGDAHAEGTEPHVCPEPEYLITLDGAALGPASS